MKKRNLQIQGRMQSFEKTIQEVLSRILKAKAPCRRPQQKEIPIVKWS